jgi:DNA-directed RNA polymerase specialized sigma24 family protein
MASAYREANFTDFATYLPAVADRARYEEIYEQNRHRVYSLAFWMTDSEIAAEEVLDSTFRRVFAMSDAASPELIDRALIASLREFMPLGVLTLNICEVSTAPNLRGNVKRVHLERAVVQLPHTERLAFLMHDVERCEHDRIARLLGISEEESQFAVHQARLRMRELLSEMPK